MAEIRPYKGLRYNSQKIKLEEVITEPYDRIPPALQEDYYGRSPYNVVRIILGKDDDPEHVEKDKYKRAKVYLNEKYMDRNTPTRLSRHSPGKYKLW